jgi:hypothetical protein
MFFENAVWAFRNDKNYQHQEKKRILKLEEKLQKKNEVLSELMEEHVKLKKELGELYKAVGFPMIPETSWLTLSRPGARRLTSRS